VRPTAGVLFVSQIVIVIVVSEVTEFAVGAEQMRQRQQTYQSAARPYSGQVLIVKRRQPLFLFAAAY
jgi:hypothetical protein